MSGHTPGPWVVNGFGGVFRLLARLAFGTTISTMVEEYGSEIDDARLIAAAPDMLEALKEIDHLACMHRKGAIGEAQSIARAAIAKAEGK